ncbi:hypothetical protein [Clostridium lacusfryxellense]|uniref:hypothetical protein n=1 Tax=Clostridium lacusfryxellense TaxID=205328 RepID=UPI001C0D0358|nr:hypothetical protein [Clostridium lacusfryxellense]MBU3112842.1 hypothetical protein [Clostridium lacusfryxellense]
MLITTVQIMAILSMLVFMFIGIWGFILLIKIYNQLRYKNYLMEKLIQNTSNLSLIHENKEPAKSDTNQSETTGSTENEILDINIKKDAI